MCIPTKKKNETKLLVFIHLYYILCIGSLIIVLNIDFIEWFVFVTTIEDFALSVTK